MANDPAKKTEQKEPAGAQARGAGASRSDPKFRRSLDDAAYNYLQDVNAAWQEYQDHVAAANETFAKTQRDANDEANKNVLQAHKDYTQAVQSAVSEEKREGVEEAQGTYVKAVREAAESKQKSNAEAYQGYVSALSGDNDAAARLKQRLEDAYRSYATAIQQIDLSRLDPESLSLLSQSVATIAAYASGQAGALGR
jgi:hypothetical protein